MGREDYHEKIISAKFLLFGFILARALLFRIKLCVGFCD